MWGRAWGRWKAACGHASGYDALFTAIACAMPLLLLGRATADIAATTIAIGFALQSAVRRDWAWSRHLDVRVASFLWLVLIVTSMWAAPGSKSIWYAAGMIRFITFYAALRYWLLAPLSAVVCKHYCVMVILSLVMVDVAVQYITGMSLTGRLIDGERLTGPLSHPNIGNYLLKIGLPALAVALVLMTGSCVRWRWVWSIGFALGLLMLVPLSGERSTTLQLIVAVGLALFFTLWRLPHYRHRVWLAGGGLVGIAAFLALTQPIVQERAGLFITQVSQFWTSVYGQLYIAAFTLGSNHPLTGTGAVQFYDACQPLLAAGRITYCDIHPHNTYLHWFSAAGVVGLLTFLTLVGIWLTQGWRRFQMATGARILTVSLAFAALIAFTFPFVVTQSIFSNWSATLYWYSIAWVMTVLDGGRRGE